LGKVKVTEIMSRPVITAIPSMPLKDAVRLLVEHGISALPVLDARGELVGIVSEADLLPMQTRPDPRAQATPQRPSAGQSPLTVGEVMTHKVLTLGAGTEVSQAARSLLEAGVKRMPVVRGHRVIGIVSRRDLIRVIARRDDSMRLEILNRIRELGLATGEEDVKVKLGVVTVALTDDGRVRNLVESVVLTVPGVLEVRFAPAQSLATGT
jgi:CBS-domain-containing membrane protein